MKHFRKILLAIGLAIFVVFLVFSDVSKVFSALSKADLKYIIAAFAISNIAIIMRAIKWHSLLEKIPFKEAFYVQNFAIALGNLTPVKITDPIKAVMIKKRTGKAVSSLLPTVVWERVLDMVILIAFSALFFLFFTTTGKLLYVTLAGLSFFIVLITVLILIIYSRKFGLLAYKILHRVPLFKSIDESFVMSFYDTKISKKRIVKGFIFTAVAWLSEGFVLYMVAEAFGFSLSMLLCISIVCLSVLVGVATALPGGIGSTEIFMSFVLTAIGVPAVPAVAVVIIVRFLSFWYDVAVGGISFVLWSKESQQL